MTARKKSTAAPDHFAVLGIKPSATRSEAKKAYNKASLEAHPDKSRDNGERQTAVS